MCCRMVSDPGGLPKGKGGSACGVSAQRGGGICPGGVRLGGVVSGRHPPVNRMIDRCAKHHLAATMLQTVIYLKI